MEKYSHKFHFSDGSEVTLETDRAIDIKANIFVIHEDNKETTIMRENVCYIKSCKKNPGTD